HEIPSDNQLLPRQELPDQEYDGGYSSPEQPDDDTFEVVAARSQIRPLQGDTAQDQDARVKPEQLWHGQRPPVGQVLAHGISDDDECKQRTGDGEKYSQPDLRCRLGHCTCAGELTDWTFFQPRFGGQALLREPPPDDDRYDRQKQDDGAHRLAP